MKASWELLKTSENVYKTSKNIWEYPENNWKPIIGQLTNINNISIGSAIISQYWLLLFIFDNFYQFRQLLGKHLF